MPGRGARSSSRVGEPPPPDAHAGALAALGLGEPARAGSSPTWTSWPTGAAASTSREPGAPRSAWPPWWPRCCPWSPSSAPGPCSTSARATGLRASCWPCCGPTWRSTLVEPRLKRWAFLREAARAAGRPDVRVFRGRHRDWPGPPAETVLLRALALPLRELRALARARGAGPRARPVARARPRVRGGARRPRPASTSSAVPRETRGGGGRRPPAPEKGGPRADVPRGTKAPSEARAILPASGRGRGAHHRRGQPEGRGGEDHHRHQPRGQPGRGGAPGPGRGLRPPGQPHLRPRAARPARRAGPASTTCSSGGAPSRRSCSPPTSSTSPSSPPTGT